MSVYVDEPDKLFGRMITCHMMADTPEELRAMALTIGMRPDWIQKKGTLDEHYDVSKSKRVLAVAAGAIEVSNRELAKWSLRRKGYNI